jgi:hypothetical protein
MNEEYSYRCRMWLADKCEQWLDDMSEILVASLDLMPWALPAMLLLVPVWALTAIVYVLRPGNAR